MVYEEKYKKYKQKYVNLKKKINIQDGGNHDCDGNMRNYCIASNCPCTNYIHNPKCITCGHEYDKHNKATEILYDASGQKYEVPIEAIRRRK